MIQTTTRTRLDHDNPWPGLESYEEEAVCRELGCHFGQGYFFSRPRNAASLGEIDCNE